MEHDTSRAIRGPLFVGILLVAAGAILLLDNLDVIYLGVPFSRFWPLLVVGFGLVRFVQAETSSERRQGFFWIFIGLWLFVSVLHMFDLGFRNSWPLLLIGFGINSIWKAISPEPQCRYVSKG